MTMVQKLRGRFTSARAALGMMVAVWASLAATWSLAGSPLGKHHRAEAPGAIGLAQLERGGPLPGYFQPVELRVPEGAIISTAGDGGFVDEAASPLSLGLLVRLEYRFRVGNIPYHPGQEVYPTLVVIDRLYPPPGLEHKFPIPVEFTLEELEMALDGKFVTRVIYLEDPDNAVPAVQPLNEQSYFEVRPGEDAVDVARTLGRPMAMLQMGGRVPDASGPDEAFLCGSPVFFRIKTKHSQLQPEVWEWGSKSKPRYQVQPASAAQPIETKTSRSRTGR